MKQQCFFEASHLDSCSCSICSYILVHTHITPHTYRQIYIYIQTRTASFLKSPEDSVDDGHVAIPMWLHTREATTARRPAGTSAPVRTSQTRRRHRSTRRRRREKSGVSYSTKTTPSPPNQAPSGNTDLILPSTNLGKKLEKSIAPNRSLDSSPTPPPPNPPQHKEEPPWRCRHRSRPRRRHQQRSPPNEHHPHELTTEKHISEDMLVGVCRRNKITTTPRRIQHQE